MSKVRRKMIKEQDKQAMPYNWHDYYGDNGVPIGQVVSYLQNFIKKYGEKATVSFVFHSDDYFGDDFNLVFNYERMETQAEADKRAERNRKARETRARNRAQEAEKKRERELKELKRLKKKYGEA